MPKTRAVVSLALALSLAAPRPAAAGCCDDFWSCAGTVATGGLSCAVEMALETVRALIATIRSDRDATSAEFAARLQETVDEMKAQLAGLEREIQAAVHEIDRANDEGDKIVKEDADTIRTKLAEAKLHASAGASGSAKVASGVPGAVPKSAIQPNGTAATPAAPPRGAAAKSRVSAAAGEMALTVLVDDLSKLQSDDSLKQLRNTLSELKKQKEALLKAIIQKESELTGKELSAANQARKSFLDNFLKPIDDLLAALDAALRNPLDAPGVVTAAARLLDGALDGFRSKVQPLVDSAADTADLAVATKTPSAARMKKIADEAAKTLAAMRKAASYRAILERKAVVRDVGVLPSTTPSAVPVSVRLRASAAFREAARQVPTRIAALRPKIQSLSTVKRSVDVSSYRLRLAGELDAAFRGKSASDSKKKLADLTAEARRRFASDPKTLAAVEKLLNGEARARGVPL